MIKNVLVIGKNGQLGQSLKKILRRLSNLSHNTNNHSGINLEFIDYEEIFVFVSREELDLSNPKSIKDFFYNKNFNGIINCAAYTSVDKAENQYILANQINNIAITQLAEIAKIQSIPLIHISTDYVFNGDKFKELNETDCVNPQNVYGLTKYKGEQGMIKSGCTGAIIRTSWLYSEFGNNFVKTMLSLAEQRDSIDVVADQVGSPTYASNLAKVLLMMFNTQKIIEVLNSQLNIYHYSDDGFCSWFEFAKTIFETADINCKVNPIKTKNFLAPAKRPQYSLMSKKKIKNFIINLQIPQWQDSLSDCLTEIKNKNLQ